jgi:hypothetical protein
MSSKAGTSKRVGKDITKQAKKIKGIDVRIYWLLQRLPLLLGFTG